MIKKMTVAILLFSALILVACSGAENDNVEVVTGDNNSNDTSEDNANDDNHHIDGHHDHDGEHDDECHDHMDGHDHDEGDHDHGEGDHDECSHGGMDEHDHSDDQHGEFAAAPENLNASADQNVLHAQTKNVTRLEATEAVDMSIYVSQLVWPATHDDNRPGTVILAPLDDWQTALASTSLIHHPNDGPVLFMENGAVSDDVLAEIDRLNPAGNENETEVMVMGDVQEEALAQLDGYEVEHFTDDTSAGFAAELDAYFSDLINEVPQSVLIASSEEEAKLFSLIAGNWIAHMNEPLLYVDQDGIPAETAEALESREGEASMYVLAPEDVISEDMMSELEEYGSVERISGETPAGMSIAFAEYQDPDTSVGWGQTVPGQGLSFISTDTPEFVIAGSALGHLGKHAPVIWLEDGEIHDSLFEYLADIRPTFADDPMDGPYNHTYLLADQDTVPFQVQGILDEKLEIAGGHGDH